MKLIAMPSSSSITVLGSSSIFVMLQALLLLNPPSVLALSDYTRKDFPPNFIFGSGTSAYQVEGAVLEDGRTPSVLDIMAHSGAFVGNGDVACDGYHKYKEDVQLMVDTGLEAYRFSISWSRLIPYGRGPVNPKAVEYYNNLINELIKHGIQPHVTLMHLDTPQALEDAYGGWQNSEIVKDFTTYADNCFQEFGDRVLHWTTINEPNCYASYISKLPYIQGHNLLLGHASVANLYKEKYKAKQHGFVGLNIGINQLIPESDTNEDIIAVERVNHFTSGWFIHPLIYGDYPVTMKQALGRQLPSFSVQDSKSIKGSFDFIGINSYTTYTVKSNHSKPGLQANCHRTDVGGKFLQDVLEHFKETYGNPPLYVHENGYNTSNDDASLHDKARVDYLKACIGGMLDATRNGTNVKGYFQWSFLDLFELPGGDHYGLYYVDLDDPNLTRYPKLSAHWYSTFLKGDKFFNPMLMKNTSWRLPKERKRQLLENNSMIKMLLKQVKINDGDCYCTPNE